VWQTGTERPLTLIRCLARLMRWATVSLATSSARRDLGGGQPAHRPQRQRDLARRVSREGWHAEQEQLRASRPTPAPCSMSAGAGGELRPLLGDAVPIRSATSPVRRRDATTVNHPRGLAGYALARPLRRGGEERLPARRPRTCRKSSKRRHQGPENLPGDRDPQQVLDVVGSVQMSHPSRAMMGRTFKPSPNAASGIRAALPLTAPLHAGALKQEEAARYSSPPHRARR